MFAMFLHSLFVSLILGFAVKERDRKLGKYAQPLRSLFRWDFIISSLSALYHLKKVVFISFRNVCFFKDSFSNSIQFFL